MVNSSDVTRGDIVVFRRGDGSTTHVKRIIALGGDHVSFTGGRPTVNGEAANWAPQAPRDQFQTYRETLNGRSYLVELSGGSSEVRDVAEAIVPAGQVYVAGDSRDRSFDSRVPVFGPVSLRAVSHKATTIVRSSAPLREGRALE